MIQYLGKISLAAVLSLACGAATQAAELQKVKAVAPLPTVSAEDIDLWAFTTVSGLAPGKTVADFRAMPNMSAEKKDGLRGVVEGKEEQASYGPVAYRFSYSDGLDLRVMDYGESAFVTRLRISGAGRTVKDEVSIGSPRAHIEQMLGRPARGGGSYAVYEGKTDVIRVFYSKEGTISSVEIDRGG